MINWWFGRTPARGNDTKTFTAETYLTGKEERLANEVILNVFTRTGIISVILHLLVFYSISYVSLHYSNNYLCKILSIFSAFRWLNCWVENINNFCLNIFLLWLLIGIVNSRNFRKMKDIEVSIWPKDIFQFKWKLPYELSS